MLAFKIRADLLIINNVMGLGISLNKAPYVLENFTNSYFSYI